MSYRLWQVPWIKVREVNQVQGQVHASGFRDRWCRGPQPREAVVVRMATVMGFVVDEIRNDSGGQVAWTLVGHGKDTALTLNVVRGF